MNVINCKTVSRVVANNLILFVNISLLSACAAGENAELASKHALELKAHTISGGVKVTLVNDTANSVVINPVFSLGYRETSIGFDFDDASEEGERTRRGSIPEILVPEMAVMWLPARGSYGVEYPISDLVAVYGLKDGCHEGRAFYDNPLGGGQYSKLKLQSNQISICIQSRR